MTTVHDIFLKGLDNLVEGLITPETMIAFTVSLETYSKLPTVVKEEQLACDPIALPEPTTKTAETFMQTLEANGATRPENMEEEEKPTKIKKVVKYRWVNDPILSKFEKRVRIGVRAYDHEVVIPDDWDDEKIQSFHSALCNRIKKINDTGRPLTGKTSRLTRTSFNVKVKYTQ